MNTQRSHAVIKLLTSLSVHLFFLHNGFNQWKGTSITPPLSRYYLGDGLFFRAGQEQKWTLFSDSVQGKGEKKTLPLLMGVVTKRSGDFLPLSAAFTEIRSPAERLINSLLRMKVEHGQFPQTQSRVRETVA